MDILKTNVIEHKGSKIKIQNPNTAYMEVISLGKYYSSGFYSKIELVEGEDYDLQLLGELVDGDECFLYCELDDGTQVIPRSYYYYCNTPFRTNIRFTAISKSINIGILFSNINKKYKLRIETFYVTKYLDPLKQLLVKDIPMCTILDLPELNKHSDSISIILPVYNGFPLIQAAIRSILRQTFTNWELIIVDDGSSINRKELLEFYNFIKQSKRVKILQLDSNNGIPVALNKGLELIEGTYWTWTSHDNFLAPSALQTIINKFQNNRNLDFIYTGWKMIGNENRTHYGRMYTKEEIMCKWDGMPFGVWHKRVLEFLGKFDEELHGIEDWEYIIRTFQICTVDYIAEALFIYYSHNDSLTSRIGDYTELKEKMWKRILEKNIGYTNYTLYFDKYKILDNLQETTEYINSINQNTYLSRGLFVLDQNTKIKKTIIYRSSVDFWVLFQRPQQLLRFLGMENKYRTIFINNGPIKRCIIHNKFILIDKDDFERYKDSLLVGERIYYFNDPDKINWANTITPNKIIFDLIDNPVEEFSVWKNNLELAINTSDIIMYSHPYLQNIIKEINNKKPIFYVSNGCDYEYFNRARDRIYPRPLDLPILKQDEKLIGYYGAFASWLDYEYIKGIANRDNTKIVMIGGIRGNNGFNIRFNHKNITWLEHKGYEDLPRYLSWFDTCLLPFKKTEMMKGCNPLKMYEYLAAEKNIIGTREEEWLDIDPRDYSYKKYSNSLLTTIFSMKNYDRVYSKDIIRYKPAIFIYPMIDYDFRIQRNQHLANYFAKNGYTVYYVRTRLESFNCDCSKTFLTHERFDYKRREIKTNLYEISLGCISPDVNVYNTVLSNIDLLSVRKSLEYVIKNEKIDFSVSIIANPFWYQLVKIQRNTQVIYDCADFLKGFNNVSEYILKIEDELIEDCDVLVVTSQKLIEKLGVSREYTLIQNGCENEYFKHIKRDNSKPKQTVGYYGAISDWFDVDVIKESALKYPDVDFHLIGNVYCVDKTHEQKIKDLSNLPNIKLIGEVPYKDLHKYLVNFDVGMIPFIPIELIECTNPVKFYEMMSMGMPIITTKLIDVDLLNNKDLFFYSNNKNEFVDNIGCALDGLNNKTIINRRKEYGNNNDWEKRGTQLEKLVINKTPLISVVVLCYNNLEYTKECLKYYDTLTKYPNNELIIVDNMSTDGSREYLKDYFQTKKNNIRLVLNCKNYGFSGGNNTGLELCRGDYIVMLNNDTCPLDQWLYQLVRPLIQDKTIGLISPLTNEIGNEGKFFLNFNNTEDLRLKIMEYNNKNNLGRLYVSNVAFFCVAMSKEIYNQVGKMDSNYGVGWFEDDDYCYRVKQKGYKIGIQKDSFIYHKGSATMNIIPDNKKELFERNKKYYENKFSITWLPHEYDIKKFNIYCSDNIIESTFRKDKFLVMNSNIDKNQNIYDFYITSNGRNTENNIKYNNLIDFKYTKLEYNSETGKKILELGNKETLNDLIYNYLNEIHNKIYI
jgi:GT2 family glycosyltransferase